MVVRSRASLFLLIFGFLSFSGCGSEEGGSPQSRTTHRIQNTETKTSGDTAQTTTTTTTTETLRYEANEVLFGGMYSLDASRKPLYTNPYHSNQAACPPPIWNIKF